jgi:hypothetical protein
VRRDPQPLGQSRRLAQPLRSAKPVGETSRIATFQASAISSRPILLPPPVTGAILPANSVMRVFPCVLAPIQIRPANLPSPPVGYT